MAELRYNIEHDWRWQTGDCYTVIYYTTSYNATTNETTVTVSETLMRLWGATDTNSSGTTTVTVTATDSGDSGSVSASASDYWWNYGFIVVQPKPSPNKIVVKHSNTAGPKSVTIYGHTGMSHWQWEYTEAAGSKTVQTGTYTPPTYNLSISAGTGSTITVNRTSSSGGGATGNLSNGATLYADDKLKITFGANAGYKLKTNTVNGATFTSGNTHTVSGNVTIAATAELQGLVYIHDGTSWNQYLIYIDNGTGWDMYVPYVDNGSGWDMCS